MPHALRIASIDFDDVDGRLVARDGQDAIASLNRISDDELAVIVRAGTRRDGESVPGGVDVLGRCEGARYRCRDLAFEVVWYPDPCERAARAGERCRCCAESLEEGATIAICACGATFCPECETARVACPECRAVSPVVEERP